MFWWQTIILPSLATLSWPTSGALGGGSNRQALVTKCIKLGAT